MKDRLSYDKKQPNALKKFSISNDKSKVLAYQEAVKKQKLLPSVKLASKEKIQDYLKKEPALKSYFCSNLNSTQTLKRGVYKSKETETLQRLFGYLFFIPVNVDSDYGLYMNSLAPIFHFNYQGEQAVRTTWTINDVIFVRDEILGCGK